MDMKTASVAELKARLSHYLRLVQQGETIEVESHRHAVARMVPPENASAALVIPPELPVAELKRLTGVRIAADVDSLEALLRDRAGR